jgi:hypothetical protein
MLDVRWKMEDGRWKMEDGRWKMEDGRWKMEDGRGASAVSLVLCLASCVLPSCVFTRLFLEA